MKQFMSALILALACGSAMALAHELTPTYPEFKPSYVRDISVTTMEMFNAREEIEFYRVDVYTENWDPIPFATGQRVIRIQHRERYTFNVFIRDSDLDKVEYICTTSMIEEGSIDSQGISSRVCSRIK